MKVSPSSNYGVGSPAEDEESHVDDGHFQSFQHGSLGKAHRGLFRSLTAILIVMVSSGTSLDLPASPGNNAL